MRATKALHTRIRSAVSRRVAIAVLLVAVLTLGTACSSGPTSKQNDATPKTCADYRKLPESARSKLAQKLMGGEDTLVTYSATGAEFTSKRSRLDKECGARPRL